MKRTNILFLFPDQHRGDFLPYTKELLSKFNITNMPVHMPNIKKMMESGAVFTDCITPSPLCAPARACLAAGCRYSDCKTPNNKFNYPIEMPSFYRELKKNGYNVGGVGKFDLNKPEPYWGEDGFWEELSDIGFTTGIDNAGKWDMIQCATTEGLSLDPYGKFLKQKGVLEAYCSDFINHRRDHYYTGSIDIPEETYCDNYICNNALSVIDGFSKDKPWFLQVNFAGPHDPWDVLDSMVEKYRNIDFGEPVMFEGNKEAINAVRQNYAAMLENIDNACGQIIEAVERRGELDNTIIIYASDHGEMLGDRNKFGKGLPYRASVHVPLIIAGTGIKKGVYHFPVELQDIAATICDLCGCAANSFSDSKSLYEILKTGAGETREMTVSALDQSINPRNKKGFQDVQVTSKYIGAVQTSKYKLTAYENKYCLYDRINDPNETVNIIESNTAVAEQLRKYMPKVAESMS